MTSLPDLIFAPVLPWGLLTAAALLGLILAVWGLARRAVPGWRLIPLAVLLLALFNPRLTQQDWQGQDDIALILVDQSPSMALGERTHQAEQTLAAVQDRLKRLPNLKIEVRHTQNDPTRDQGTRLFDALDRALADLPRQRLAGVLLITDGQVADIPAKAGFPAPLHVLLAGHKAERDRRLVLDKAPSFGIVGSTAALSFKVEDPGQTGSVAVTLRRDGGKPVTVAVPVNRPTSIELPIDHAGPNIIELEAAAAPDELTLDNNRAVIAVNGVRDRLKVLLISGEPHAGERTWRNLLKADPSVDLVHFTILRPPEKDDRTPMKELALISFPVRELFEEKLHGFDLIIFDRYRRRSVLPPAYYQNIASYVQGGGALLLAAGPEYAGTESPYGSALADILPAAPTGSTLEEPFQPRVTALGKRHPVTAALPGAENDPPRWGRWMRLIGSRPGPGGSGHADVVMSNEAGQPLLVLDHVGEGRVAELLSDSPWLWGRGWEGGGPQAELLRRLAHWLMKEPELEENQLAAEIHGNRLSVRRQSIDPAPPAVEVTAPNGDKTALALTDRGDGVASGDMTVTQAGLWRVADGKKVALAAIGALNPVEMAEVRATPDKLAPIVRDQQGGIAWIEDGIPDMRPVEAADRSAGHGWFGWRANHDRVVTAVKDAPLLPPLVLLIFGLGGLVLSWWREGK